LRWSGVVSSASNTKSLSIVVQSGLGVGCVMIDACRTVMISGVVVASVACLIR
jgi:hypothetical protein